MQKISLNSTFFSVVRRVFRSASAAGKKSEDPIYPLLGTGLHLPNDQLDLLFSSIKQRGFEINDTLGLAVYVSTDEVIYRESEMIEICLFRLRSADLYKKEPFRSCRAERCLAKLTYVLNREKGWFRWLEILSGIEDQANFYDDLSQWEDEKKDIGWFFLVFEHAVETMEEMRFRETTV